MGAVGNPSCQAAAARWQLGPSHLKASINVSASWAGTIATATAAEGGGHGSGISDVPQPLHMPALGLHRTRQPDSLHGS